MTSRARFAGDFLALLTGRGMTQALTLLVGLFLVRALADSVFGAYSLATTTIGLIGVIADAGLDPVLTREIARAPVSVARLVRYGTALRLSLTGLLGLAAVALALTTAGIGRADLLLIGCLALLPRAALRTVAAAMTGLHQVRRAALAEGSATVSSAILTVAFILLHVGGDGAAGAIWALAAGNLIGLAVIWLAGWQAVHHRATAGTPVAGPVHDTIGLLRIALPFLILTLVGTLFQSLDIYIVQAYYTGLEPGAPDAVALYAAPFRVLNVLLLIPTAWGVVALPRYTRYARRQAALRLALRRDLPRGLLGGLAISMACTLLAGPLTRLVLGPTYAPEILAVLGWMTLPVCLSAPLIAVLTATNRAGRIILCVVAAGLLALALNLALAGAWQANGSLIPALTSVAAIKVGTMILLGCLYALALPRALLQWAR